MHITEMQRANSNSALHQYAQRPSFMLSGPSCSYQWIKWPITHWYVY